MEATATQAPAPLPISTRVELARTSKRELARWIRRFDRWMAACDLLAAGDDSQWRRMRPPSKASKHQAYGSAGHVLRCVGSELASDLTGVPAAADGSIHPQTVDHLRSVVAAFESRYGK